jgi:hypothetical protein
VQYLCDTWGQELVMIASSNFTACLHAARQNGRISVVDYLTEVCRYDVCITVSVNVYQQ